MMVSVNRKQKTAINVQSKTHNAHEAHRERKFQAGALCNPCQFTRSLKQNCTDRKQESSHACGTPLMICNARTSNDANYKNHSVLPHRRRWQHTAIFDKPRLIKSNVAVGSNAAQEKFNSPTLVAHVHNKSSDVQQVQSKLQSRPLECLGA